MLAGLQGMDSGRGVRARQGQADELHIVHLLCWSGVTPPVTGGGYCEAGKIINGGAEGVKLNMTFDIFIRLISIKFDLLGLF
jgi:hypothetical protein